MLKSTIVDTRVRMRPSKKLLDFLGEQKEHLKELPANLSKILEKNGYSIANNTRILRDDEIVCKRPKIDVKLLNKLTANLPDVPSNVQEINEFPEEEEEPKQPLAGDFLYLNDLHFLNSILIELRKNNVTNVFLHELIESCELILPENEYKPRNPELEARCQRLRDEQQNREYHKMTKNVDATLKHIPEDTVAYQCELTNAIILHLIVNAVNLSPLQ